MFRVECAGFKVQGSGFEDHGAWFRVQGAGCRVEGGGCRVQGGDLERRAEKLDDHHVALRLRPHPAVKCVAGVQRTVGVEVGVERLGVRVERGGRRALKFVGSACRVGFCRV